MSRLWLLPEDVLAIHFDQVERYGGTPEIRDMGQLQAALFRPQTGYYKDLIEEAAALWESLSQNHPFMDGNKPTAFAAAFVFLQINGLDITATAPATWKFLNRLYDRGELTFEHLEKWLRANTAPIKD